jgi:hypothetical protein
MSDQMKTGLVAMTENGADPPIRMRFLQDPTNRTGSSYCDLLAIDWWAKRVQRQIPTFGLSDGAKSDLFQPTASPRIVIENPHQVVSLSDPKIKDARGKRPNRHTAKQPLLSHAADRMQDQLVCNAILIWMGSYANCMDQSER